MDELLADLRLLNPGLPDAFLRAWADAWVEEGDRDVALAQVRADPRYTDWFPGIRRGDGTLRMSEAEYGGRIYGYRAQLASVGVNPDLFEAQLPRLIEGEVSVNEFAQRVDAVYQRISQNIGEVREQFAQFQNLPEMTDEAIIAWALNPDIGSQIINREITVAQVAAEASRQGFFESRTRAAQLTAFGVNQQTAREVYGQAAALVPRLDQFAARYTGDTDVDVDEFTDAAVFGDLEQSERLGRLLSQDRAMYAPGSQVQRSRFGQLSGLTER